MVEENDEYEIEQAKILLRTEQKLGRKLYDSELRKLLKIKPKKGLDIRTKTGRKPYGIIDPETGKQYEEI